jgi:hypothetical protein
VSRGKRGVEILSTFYFQLSTLKRLANESEVTVKQMVIRIGKDGKVRIDVNGAVGQECREFTRLFEQAVGTVEKRELKAEHDMVGESVTERTQVSAQ